MPSNNQTKIALHWTENLATVLSAFSDIKDINVEKIFWEAYGEAESKTNLLRLGFTITQVERLKEAVPQLSEMLSRNVTILRKLFTEPLPIEFGSEPRNMKMPVLSLRRLLSTYSQNSGFLLNSALTEWGTNARVIDEARKHVDSLHIAFKQALQLMKPEETSDIYQRMYARNFKPRPMGLTPRLNFVGRIESLARGEQDYLQKMLELTARHIDESIDFSVRDIMLAPRNLLDPSCERILTSALRLEPAS